MLTPCGNRRGAAVAFFVAFHNAIAADRPCVASLSHVERACLCAAQILHARHAPVWTVGRKARPEIRPVAHFVLAKNAVPAHIAQIGGIVASVKHRYRKQNQG